MRLQEGIVRGRQSREDGFSEKSFMKESDQH